MTKTKKHNTISDGHHYTQSNTDNVNKTWALQPTTRGKDKPNTILYLPFHLLIFEFPPSCLLSVVSWLNLIPVSFLKVDHLKNIPWPRISHHTHGIPTIPYPSVQCHIFCLQAHNGSKSGVQLMSSLLYVNFRIFFVLLLVFWTCYLILQSTPHIPL